jgi:hypothetical protein
VHRSDYYQQINFLFYFLIATNQRQKKEKKMPRGHGTNSQGNTYNTPGGTNSNESTSYHYSNQDGSYYYKNDNGSSYYNSGSGYSNYTSPPTGGKSSPSSPGPSGYNDHDKENTQLENTNFEVKSGFESTDQQWSPVNDSDDSQDEGEEEAAQYESHDSNQDDDNSGVYDGGHDVYEDNRDGYDDYEGRGDDGNDSFDNDYYNDYDEDGDFGVDDSNGDGYDY